MTRTAFLERSPLTRQALAFADERHAGQKREIDGDIPFVTHPIEAACLLREAGHPDEVVAAGLLHDVLEDTDAEPRDLEERFGPEVTQLVAAVSDDPSIDDDARRRAALRQQVAEAGERAALIFAEAPGEVARFLSDQPIRTRSALFLRISEPVWRTGRGPDLYTDIVPTARATRALLGVIYFNDAAPDGGLLLLDAFHCGRRVSRRR